MDYTLPDGFRWTEKAPEYLEFKHVATGRISAVSHCERAVTPDPEIQHCIDYAVNKMKLEIARDLLWNICDADPEEFKRLRDARKDFPIAAAL